MTTQALLIVRADVPNGADQSPSINGTAIIICQPRCACLGHSGLGAPGAEPILRSTPPSMSSLVWKQRTPPFNRRASKS